MPKYPVLPSVKEDATSWRFLAEDLSPVFTCLSDDPSLWGVDLMYFRTGNTCIPTNRKSWLKLKHDFPSVVPVMLSGLKSRASLEVLPDQLGAAEPHLY